MRVNSTKYHDWQILDYEGVRDRNILQSEKSICAKWLSRQPPAVERHDDPQTKEILRRFVTMDDNLTKTSSANDGILTRATAGVNWDPTSNHKRAFDNGPHRFSGTTRHPPGCISPGCIRGACTNPKIHDRAALTSIRGTDVVKGSSRDTVTHSGGDTTDRSYDDDQYTAHAEMLPATREDEVPSQRIRLSKEYGRNFRISF